MAFIILFQLSFFFVVVVNHDTSVISSAKIDLWKPPYMAPVIYGGNHATGGQFPFMVFVMYKLGHWWSSCSASLVRDDVVLLAAHCFKTKRKKVNPQNIIAVAGQTKMLPYLIRRTEMSWDESVDETEFGVQERRAIAAKKHSLYDPESKFFDIGLFQVDKPFVLSPFVQTIKLSAAKLKTRRSCTILGWGLQENTHERRLVFARGVVARPAAMGCGDDLDSSHFICLEKRNAGICSGDSGSPLVCAGKVWAVASHTISRNQTATCGRDLGEFYVDIYENIHFISKFLERARQRRENYEHTDVTDKNIAGNDVGRNISFNYLVFFVTITYLFSFYCSFS